MNDAKLYQEELEELTGKIFVGDLTPLVYDLLKDTNDLPALIKHLGGVVVEQDDTPTDVQPLPSFEELFAQGQTIKE